MRISVGAASCIFFGYMMSQYFGQTWPPEESSDRPILDIKYEAAFNPVLSTLEMSETTFESTIRSCLGPNCFDEATQDNGVATDRVGLLAPLHSGGELISAFLNNLKSTQSKKKPIVLVYETHVPSYGYGKNHGWSRIIRLVRKIIPHSLSLVVGLDFDKKKRTAAVDIQVSKRESMLKIVEIC